MTPKDKYFEQLGETREDRLIALVEEIQAHHYNIAKKLFDSGIMGVTRFYHAARAMQIYGKLQACLQK